MKVGENAVFSLFSFFKEWYKSSLYPKHSFSRKRKLQKACQWWVYTFWAKTVRFSEFWKTFPVEMLFFTQKIYIRKTKKVSKMHHLCSESLLGTFTPTFLCFFSSFTVSWYAFQSPFEIFFETEMLFQNETQLPNSSWDAFTKNSSRSGRKLRRDSNSLFKPKPLNLSSLLISTQPSLVTWTSLTLWSLDSGKAF